MDHLVSLTNEELLQRLPLACSKERSATAEVIVYLAEVERRRLYLDAACASMYSFCVERLGYSEQAALKRVRVARLYRRLPRVLDELRSGAVHLTGLFLVSNRLTDDNAEVLLAEVRGKTRREIERVLASWFPKSDLLPMITPLAQECGGVAAKAGGFAPVAEGATYPGIGEVVAAGGVAPVGEGVTCPGNPGTGEVAASGGVGRTAEGIAYPGVGAPLDATGPRVTYPGVGESAHGAGRGNGAREDGPRARVQPLSARSYHVGFTASAELVAKLEHAQALLSHVVAPGALGEIFERALDELIAKETKQRQGVASDKPRKDQELKAGSRHVPLRVAREVWNRDGSRCTFVDEHGRRCSARRFLTLEHIDPHARGGPPVPENLCLLCGPHNQHAARREFGDAHIAAKQREAKTFSKAKAALVGLGFQRRPVCAALETLRQRGVAADLEGLLRQAVLLLTPSKLVPHGPPASQVEESTAGSAGRAE